MKKILLAVTAALAITSCSQNEEFENEGQKAEINFTTIVSKATRASELKTEGLKTNGGFKVLHIIQRIMICLLKPFWVKHHL